MVAYVEAVTEQIVNEQVEEVLSDSDKTSSPNLGGRPTKGRVSQEKVSERTGMPRSTISTAQTHVDTVEKFPFMQSWSQAPALKASPRNPPLASG